MRAAWIERWGGPLRVGERDDPEPGEGEVLVEVEACGIGLTVLNCMRGDLGDDEDDLPRIPGHELVGTIVGCGESVDPGRAGERIAAYFYLVCGRCERCLAEEEPLCTASAGYLGVHRDGGYGRRVCLPARNALTLPEGIEPVPATAIPDAIATPVHVASRAGIGPGDRVAVIAAGGGVGVHMVQVAALAGAEVLGLEASPAKLGYLEDELGVGAADSSDFDAVELPRGWEPGADVIVDLLGSEESLAWAHASVAPRGRMVVLTTFPGVGFAASPRDLVFGETAVMGSRYASRGEVLQAARLVAEGRVDPVVSLTVGVDEVERAHEALRGGELVGRAALAWD